MCPQGKPSLKIHKTPGCSSFIHLGVKVSLVSTQVLLHYQYYLTVLYCGLLQLMWLSVQNGYANTVSETQEDSIASHKISSPTSHYTSHL